MSDTQQLLTKTKAQLGKALQHLDYSYRKVGNLSPQLNSLGDEDLETWEGFVSRFARVCDLFLMRYLRTWILRQEGAFRGSMRDYCDQAEKLGLIDSAEAWMLIRELRNKISHEYADERLQDIFEEARRVAPKLLDLRNLLSGH
ncbi:MAG: nucleotidyltransferase substrate binding protein [Proteobacteria bacterium]|nr:nucleotidyltransferase substrate binding protein [Pseudomonadota bacterium]